MTYSEEQFREIYNRYKELCDSVSVDILKLRKGFTKKEIEDTALIYVLACAEATFQGKEPPKLEEYITEFLDVRKPILENLTAHSPTSFIMPNHKIVNAISKYGTFEEIAATKVISKAPEIETKATLHFDDNITLPKNYTQYDRAVLNAICSLYNAGNKAFTPIMVFRSMTGRTNDETIEPSVLKAVTESIEKQRRAIVKIDGTEELTRRKVPGVESLTFDENILNLTAATIKVNGVKTKGYIFVNKPVLYRYCETTKQIITVPIQLLNTKSIKNTPDIIVIREYLLRQIELIKKGIRNNKKILYETVFEECGITVNNKTVAKRYRDYISRLLEAWIEKGYIKAYKEYKKGNKFMGVEIKF